MSCGWGKGAGQVVQDQNLYALAVVGAEVLLVTRCLSEGMGAESEGRSGKDKKSEVDMKAQEEGHGSEGGWAVAVPVTETLMDREAD